MLDEDDLILAEMVEMIKTGNIDTERWSDLEKRFDANSKRIHPMLYYKGKG
jgi:hypothetical protein